VGRVHVRTGNDHGPHAGTGFYLVDIGTFLIEQKDGNVDGDNGLYFAGALLCRFFLYESQNGQRQ
jgi:hypothetical protein